MQPLDLIIFDLDGTLYQSNPTIDAAYPKACLNLITRHTGLDTEATAAQFQQQRQELSKQINGRPTNTLTLFRYYKNISVEEYEQEVNRLLDVETHITYDETAFLTIAKIARFYPIFLFTTNNATTTKRILKKLHLERLFPADARLTLSDLSRLQANREEAIHYIKPGERGFRRIMDKFQTIPTRVLMVGDSEVSDITPAQKLGLLTYHVKDREALYRLPEWLGI
jgi:FMN phosphatase YigB (HAD superfamily)